MPPQIQFTAISSECRILVFNYVVRELLMTCSAVFLEFTYDYHVLYMNRYSGYLYRWNITNIHLLSDSPFSYRVMYFIMFDCKTFYCYQLSSSIHPNDGIKRYR